MWPNAFHALALAAKPNPCLALWGSAAGALQYHDPACSHGFGGKLGGGRNE